MSLFFLFLFACGGRKKAPVAVAPSPPPAWRVPRPGLGMDDVFHFTLPEAKTSQQSKRLKLWATYYYLPVHEYSEKNEYPLLDHEGNKLGPTLDEEDWCMAALQGSVVIRKANGVKQTYNYHKLAKEMQVKCGAYYRYTSSGRIRFRKATGPFGDGATGRYILFPYRSIAVDKTRIPYGTIVYIPKARGLKISLQNGKTFTHDGYFFANDTGGAIKGRHIDVFQGVEIQDTFTHFIKSTKKGTFQAYHIKDKELIRLFHMAHLKEAPYLYESGF